MPPLSAWLPHPWAAAEGHGGASGTPPPATRPPPLAFFPVPIYNNYRAAFPLGGGGPAGPDEGPVCHCRPLTGNYRRPCPHQSAGGAADSFPRGGSLSHAQKKQTPLLCSVCYAVAYCPAGSVNTNRHQLPSSLSAWIWPPERLIRILQICSPSPLPRVFMPRERSSL